MRVFERSYGFVRRPPPKPPIKGACLSRLRRISAPTQFIWGAQDGIVTPDYGRAYASHVPGAAFTQIEEAGHLPHVEQPDAFLRELNAFI